MYELNVAERRILHRIETSMHNNKNIPTPRVIEYMVDNIARMSVAPIPVDFVPLIACITPGLAALQAVVASKKNIIGTVSMDVSLFDEKWAELPALLTGFEATARIAYPNDEITMKYLMFTDRKAFNVGGQQERIDILNGWLLRLAAKPLIPTVLSDATTWVNDFNLKLTTKGNEKSGVKIITVSETAAREKAFFLMRQNFGNMYFTHADDLRVLINCYDPNLLEADTKSPDRLLKNQFLMNPVEGQIETSVEGTYVPKGSVITDNKKNTSGVWTWLSMTVPTVKPDYAKFTAGETSEENTVQELGPKYAKYYNAMFDDQKATGSIKITVKKRM